MLHRAANNAYSWWWASHIRTKQSKWMEQNLQDMEEKVQTVMKLIEEDGDSFARRAEMYYKKRPELIHFVEESYRAYRALAERYDHISTELQNANTTIASVCPDQVHFMEEDDDEAQPRSPRIPRKMPDGFKSPNIPKPPVRDFKIANLIGPKKLHLKKTSSTETISQAPKSGLSKEEALEEVDKLQKQILGLQTVKEFVKSTYDNAIATYWETEEQIQDLQDKVLCLQDEIGEVPVIDDNEARRLMAEAALKSCQVTLSQMQVKQEKAINETRVESKKIQEIKKKFESLKDEFQYNPTNQNEPKTKRDAKEAAETKGLDEEERMTQERQSLRILQEKIKEHFGAGSHSSLSVAEMAERINELVNEVVSLETAVSSQAALIRRLRIEIEELQSQIRGLDKANLINNKNNLNNQLSKMEEKMNGIEDLNQIVENQHMNLQTQFTEAGCKLDHLSEKVQNLQQDNAENTDFTKGGMKPLNEADAKHEVKGEDALNQDNVLIKDVYLDKNHSVNDSVVDGCRIDASLQLKEQKRIIDLKDEEIRYLRQKMDLLQKSSEGDEEFTKLSLSMPADNIDEILKTDSSDSDGKLVIEQKFRLSIDKLLEENLEFWLKFSTIFTEIQKFDTTIKDLVTEASQVGKKLKASEGNTNIKYSLKSDARAIYKHLEEIQTELTGWLGKSALLKQELNFRFTSLCDIQEEITVALKVSAEDDEFKFTSFQAAKFQGEILNMKQENNKVADELQAGQDHVTTLQLEVKKVLEKLNEQFDLQTSHMKGINTPNRVPLRAFIFGDNPKKQKPSIFSFMTFRMHRKRRSRLNTHM